MFQATLCLALLIIGQTYAVVFTKCELAEILNTNGFPKNQLPDWICLVQSESAFNSSAIGGPNKNGSYDNGLFQINDGYWCDYGKPGKDCDVACEDLVSDDITASLVCAKKIFKIQGFSAWHGWTKRCKGKILPDLSNCNL